MARLCPSPLESGDREIGPVTGASGCKRRSWPPNATSNRIHFLPGIWGRFCETPPDRPARNSITGRGVAVIPLPSRGRPQDSRMQRTKRDKTEKLTGSGQASGPTRPHTRTRRRRARPATPPTTANNRSARGVINTGTGSTGRAMAGVRGAAHSGAMIDPSTAMPGQSSP